ncbi:PREDICTED: HMG box-containing protein 4-like isoform X2 [Ceratosolen solmsi marchali]|uniref:HMG box-containing protein 4-like isoform X2 n=1 Tax=Ceratosolen solmsi marchali TaxID=326594 RepID=A0AAJ6YT16_9HYME|nr:PREDICTED: HMG box-containing protein 4-like isoform X2 [Ceratosolen solmsi marchali]
MTCSTEMEAFAISKREYNELEVTGVSRSGRVCKKSYKLMDFESSSNVIENKIKKPKFQLPHEQAKKKKSIEYQQVHSPVSQVIHTVHVAQIHHPPPNRDTIISSKKDIKLSTISIHKKKKIESSSDYETQSQSTNSESDEDDNKKLHIAEFSSNNMRFDTSKSIDDQIVIPKTKLLLSTKPKKKVIPLKLDMKPKLKAMVISKPKTRYTAYMLWSKEMRLELLKDCPTMDFTSISKRLGELWAMVPNMEKYNWSNRAKRLAEKNQTISPKKFISKTNQIKSCLSNSPKKNLEISRLPESIKVLPFQSSRNGKEAIRDPIKEMNIFRDIELQPIDIAAYLKLLGESLTVIGEKLKEHNGQITVSGSLSVLLDSLLCALGSLICLSQQIPIIGHRNAISLSKTLENIAYIMPGL